MPHELILQVLTLDGQPVEAEPIRFEPLGGTIGRSPECTMVLADESRSVSRVHAHIRFSNGAFEFQQTADNFSQLNGQAVDPLVPVALANGDLLSIGQFLVEVTEAASAAREALLGKTNLFIKPSSVRSLGAASATSFATSAPTSASASAPATATASATAATTALRAVPREAYSFDASDRASELHPQSSTHAVATHAMSAASGAFPPALDAFLQPRNASPAATHSAHRTGAPLPSSASDGARTTIPDDYDFTSDPGQGGLAAVASKGTSNVGAAAASTTLSTTPLMPPSPSPSSTTSPAVADADAASNAILAALCEGLGVANDVRFATLDPHAFALLAGQMLRASLGSAIDVLRSRAIVKREAGMEATMIVARENNPLKFFPDVDAALPVMLGNRPGAYLPPVQAIQEAFADIHTHELGMLAGISASLADQLLQLDPDHISDAATPSAMQRMFGKQKVAAWDVFVERQATLRTALDESAGALSSEAFRGAYQAQVDGHQSIKGGVYRAAK